MFKWKVNILLLLFLTCETVVFAQEDTAKVAIISEAVGDLVTALDKGGVYWERGLTIDGLSAKQEDRYIRLKRLATYEELVLIIETAGPVAQAYAYRILVERNNPIVYKILLKNLHYTDLLEVGVSEYLNLGEIEVAEIPIPGNVNRKSHTLIGKDGIPEDEDFSYGTQPRSVGVGSDVSKYYYMGDFFYHRVHSHNSIEEFCNYENNSRQFTMIKSNLNILREGYYLSKEENDYIEFQFLIDKNIKLEARLNFLREMEPDPKYYVIVRNIYLNEGIPEALMALARYNNNDDIPFIRVLLHSKDKNDQFIGVKALQYFPAPELFEDLEIIHMKIVQKMGLKYCYIRQSYKAVVAYKSPESRELLEFSIYKVKNSMRDYHMRSLQTALIFNDDPIFDGIEEMSEKSKRELKKMLKN